MLRESRRDEDEDEEAGGDCRGVVVVLAAALTHTRTSRYPLPLLPFLLSYPPSRDPFVHSSPMASLWRGLLFAGTGMRHFGRSGYERRKESFDPTDIQVRSEPAHRSQQLLLDIQQMRVRVADDNAAVRAGGVRQEAVIPHHRRQQRTRQSHRHNARQAWRRDPHGLPQSRAR